MSAQVPRAQAENEPRSPNEERRAVVRFSVDGSSSCEARTTEAGPWFAEIRDVSVLGVGVALPCAVPLNTMLDVELGDSIGASFRPILGRVIHVEDTGEGVWIVGCAFVSELSETQLRLFQAQKVRADAPDARRWLRFPCNVETVCYTCDTTPGERRPSRILNVSANGIGLLLPCQFGGGTLLHLELPAEAARLALIRIVHVVEHGASGWFHGCEFVDQLGAEELQDLLR